MTKYTDKETKYRDLVNLIKNNNLRIVKKSCCDPQSGWSGDHLIIMDKDEPICDLSYNGYCFKDESVDYALEKVDSYLELKNMNTFEAFYNWVYSVAVNE